MGRAVKLLIDARLHQVKDHAAGKLIRLHVNAVMCIPVCIRCQAAPGEYRQQWFQLQLLRNRTAACYRGNWSFSQDRHYRKSDDPAQNG